MTTPTINRRPTYRWWWLRTLINAAVLLGVGIFLIFLLGVAQRRGWIGTTSSASAEEGTVEYICPMHPQIRQPKPGRCPICDMDLVPPSELAAQVEEYAVHITPAVRRIANIQTVPVEAKALTRTIRVPGILHVDESRQAVIAAYTGGRIERMYADYTGISVEEGQHMVMLFSPELYSAQTEYLESKATLAEMQGGLTSVVESHRRTVGYLRRRLIELGMTEQQVAELDQTNQASTRLTIYAPLGGTVIRKDGVKGEYVQTGDVLYEIANLDTIWLMLELFPDDAAQIRFGQQVRAELPSLPGQEILGRVAFIDKVVAPKTRTVGVRVELLNLDGQLRPEDYATAIIEIPIGETGQVYDAALAGKWISPMHPQIIRDQPGDCPICGMELVSTKVFGYSDEPVPQPKSIVVPREAVLNIGQHSVVYVEEDSGKFTMRRVKVGAITDEYVSIIEGLEVGEAVATAGNFLIDSQMQLHGNPSLIDPTQPPSPSQMIPEGPFELDQVAVQAISGESGQQLEDLYSAYLAIQATLAQDKTVSEAQATALRQSALAVNKSADLPAEVHTVLETIPSLAEHLHHMGIAEARSSFKTISHAMIKLAGRVRGEGDSRSLRHFYCSMVSGGGGDWLQATEDLTNPYKGSDMLHCGELIRTLPPAE